MKSTVSGFTAAAVVLAANLCVTVAGPHRAYAAPGLPSNQSDSDLAVTVLSPTPRASFSGTKPVEISAFYQGSSSNQIVSIELYVDGAKAYTKNLDAPETKGVISFLVDASQLSAGSHKIVVRAVAADAEVVSAKTSFVYVADSTGETAMAPNTNSGAGAPAEMIFVSPQANQKVEGTVHIELQPAEGGTQTPYVSVFVDGQFKTMRNYAPYTYDWDTSSYSNGYHTIEVYAYDENQHVGPAKAMRIYVNNPGGLTSIRTDLRDDTAATVKPRTSRHAAGDRFVPALTDDANAKPAATRPVPTRPIDKRIAKSVVPSRSATAATPSGSKAVGPMRRPSPRMAMIERKRELSELRAILMAKRPDLLDQTGGLDLSSQLSDPFIPDTATPRPSAQTPMSGFKPLPHKPVATALSSSATALTAHTISPIAPAPAQVDIHVPTAQAPQIEANVPSLPTNHVEAAHPTIAKPAQVAVHAPTAPAHHPAGAPVMAAGAGKPHAASPAAPATIDVHTPSVSSGAADMLLATPAIPTSALQTHVRATHPAIAKPAAVAVHTPAAPHHPTGAPVMVAGVAKPHAASPAAPATIDAHTASISSGAADMMLATPAIPASALRTHVQAAHPVTVKTVQVAHPVTMAHAPRPIHVQSVRQISIKPVRVATPRVTAMQPTVAVATPMKIVGTHQVRIHIGGASLMRARGKSAVYFNSVRVQFDRPIMVRHGVLYMPLRQLMEFQGANLTWDEKTQTVHSISEDKELTVQIGKRHAAVNKSAVKLDGAAFLSNGRTMVPVSFLSKVLGAEVHCDPISGHVMLTSRA